jgi:antitoxin component YwqK of YwqJK toxin-antitoxin module
MILYHEDNYHIIELEPYDDEIEPNIFIDDWHKITAYDPDHTSYMCNKFRAISIQRIFSNYVDNFESKLDFSIFDPNDEEYPYIDPNKRDKIIHKNDYIYIPLYKFICYFSKNDAIYNNKFEYLIKYSRKENIDFVGYCRKYHKNGYLKTEFFHNNGIKEGAFKKYHYNKKLKIEANFVNNKLSGKYVEYNDYGNIILQCYYNDNKKDGECIEYTYNDIFILTQKIIIYKDDMIIKPIITRYFESNDIEYRFIDTNNNVCCTIRFNEIENDKYIDIIQKIETMNK